jgi:lipopolysaccharide-induced tumor necrosis factor-alpha factor
MAGQKLNCPGCGQRLQIPQPPVLPQNKTMLAVPESNAASQTAANAPSPAVHPPPMPTPGAVRQEPIEIIEVVHESPQRRVEHCLECGRNMADRAAPLVCPDCGSAFCSSGCLRDHRRYAHGKRKRKRSSPVTGFRCVYCGSTEPPYRTTQISSDGWILFVLLLIFCFPLFWIGLLITEERRHCYDCGARLS